MSRGCAFHPLSISSGRTRSRALNGELRGASRFGVRTAAITVSALIFSIPNLSIVASLDASATPGVPAIASTNSNRATAERIVLSPPAWIQQPAWALRSSVLHRIQVLS